MLAAGSVLRIIGAILGGFAIMILGVMLLAPLSFVGPNPFGFFATFGVALILGGISVMLTGVGWSLQTWGRG
ncbi:MAG TPA: hypothetical protein VJ397_00395 [Thermoplasmata archaeon]|nr:hypothetical protein [Thermoplasmata archaeon]